ncbi:hypothetical protein HRM2_29290 [Desulforapulum autotrophicum HRM2]|uniref:Uncharacterized protein n=1 Tax=Desulforapulum autotrophicum (strain ATCC 43914 / DSM 3382 / VKM B-1955 / HRM2) TaxID=177437 RepID=C0QJZ1_DESAH|nr:hypothetical protein HRM2_29290 [Desulforapulum autotrophicum HRM2]
MAINTGRAAGICLMNIEKQRESDFWPGQTRKIANCLREERPSFCDLGLSWSIIPRLYRFSKQIPAVTPDAATIRIAELTFTMGPNPGSDYPPDKGQYHSNLKKRQTQDGRMDFPDAGVYQHPRKITQDN